MRAAIANAEVGDEQRGEEPTVNRLQFVTRSYDGQGTSDGFTAYMAGQAWSIDGERVRFRGAFNADGSFLAGTWERRGGEVRWSPRMDIDLRKVK